MVYVSTKKYKFITETEEEFRTKGPPSEVIEKWAKPVMEEIDRKFTEDPEIKAVKITKFPEDFKPKTVNYKIRGKDITRIVPVAQQALPLLGAVLRSNQELRNKYSFQLSADKSTINVYSYIP